MKIFVKAKAGAKETKVLPPIQKLWQTDSDKESILKEWFTVSVKEPPAQGKANEAIIKALAEYFKVSNSRVRLISGSSTKQKVFEIL